MVEGEGLLHLAHVLILHFFPITSGSLLLLASLFSYLVFALHIALAYTLVLLIFHLHITVLVYIVFFPFQRSLHSLMYIVSLSRIHFPPYIFSWCSHRCLRNSIDVGR